MEKKQLFGGSKNPIETLAGQYFDQETGLHYNYHRHYDPRTGRYLTPDPIGLAGGINLFAYTDNNPVNYIDPWGLTGLTTVDAAFNQAVLSGNIAQAKAIAEVAGLSYATMLAAQGLSGPDDPTDQQQWIDWPGKRDEKTTCETRQPDPE